MKLINDRRRLQGQSGFTLIELLVVIAILGVLAGVVVFSVNGLSNDSAKSACSIDKRTMQTGVEAYRAANNTYPAVAGDSDGVDIPQLESDSEYWKYSLSVGNTPVYTALKSPSPC